MSQMSGVVTIVEKFDTLNTFSRKLKQHFSLTFRACMSTCR